MRSTLRKITIDLQGAGIQADLLYFKLSNIISLCLIGSTSFPLFSTPS